MLPRYCFCGLFREAAPATCARRRLLAAVLRAAPRADPIDRLHLGQFPHIEVEADAAVAITTRTASSSLPQKRQEAALRRLASACASSLRARRAGGARDVWSAEFAADVKATRCPPRGGTTFNDRPVRDLGMIRRLAVETCAADASAALEALEVWARRNAAARDPRAGGVAGLRCLCRRVSRAATPRHVEAPAKGLCCGRPWPEATSVAILVASRDQARSVASFLKVGEEAACLVSDGASSARSAAPPSKASRDTPYQRLVRAELDDALEERDDDGDQALADALALSLEEAEDDAIKAAIAGVAGAAAVVDARAASQKLWTRRRRASRRGRRPTRPSGALWPCPRGMLMMAASNGRWRCPRPRRAPRSWT